MLLRTIVLTSQKGAYPRASGDYYILYLEVPPVLGRHSQDSSTILSNDQITSTFLKKKSKKISY